MKNEIKGRNIIGFHFSVKYFANRIHVRIRITDPDSCRYLEVSTYVLLNIFNPDLHPFGKMIRIQ